LPFNVANEMNRRRGIVAEQNLADMEDYVDDRNRKIDGLCQLIENYKKIRSQLKNTIVNRIGGGVGKKDFPRDISLQLLRIRSLSDLTSIFYIKAEKRTVSELREATLDTIAWAEYIQLTEDYIPKLTKEMKTYLDEQKERVSDADYKHFMGLLFEETEFVEDMQRNPKQWVKNRKNELKKTIKYPNRKSIEPTLNSFESPKPRIFPENVLQFKGSKELGYDSGDIGLYGIRNNIIGNLNKHCRI